MAEQPGMRQTPEWPSYGRDGCTGIRVEGAERCLAHVDLHARRLFLAGLRPGADVDLRGTQVSAALLEQLLAAVRSSDRPPRLGVVQCERVQFVGDVVFDQAQFTEDIDFTEAEFLGSAQFRAAVFDGSVSFGEAEFHGSISLDETQFGGEALFGKAQFTGPASFSGVRFGSNASFRRARFTRIASFTGTQFNGTAFLDVAEFNGNAQFSDAQFNGAPGSAKRSSGDLSKNVGLMNRLTQTGEVLRVVVRLTGPVLLGLALLSVRNRVKR
jgi:uncharacterized protein YjbI with pentapeptide repeats